MILVLLAPVIALLAIGAVMLGLTAQRRRQYQLIGRVVDSSPSSSRSDIPSVLFFTGVNCTICHTAQRPALDALEAQTDSRVTVREIDIADQPEVARRYRVMSLPTTIVLDTDGAVSAINVGFANAERLREQLAMVGVLTAA
jgi:thiol-disulfide isomerase/thioredoxin